MNIHRTFPPNTRRPVKFTADAYLEHRALINRSFEKTELLDGVIYEMPADGPLTIEWNMAINMWLVKNLPDAFHVVPDKTLKIAEYWAPTPDFYIIPAHRAIADIKPADVALVIEVSDKTLDYDLGEKANLYAGIGIGEYWVFDPNEKTLHAHRLNESGTYDAPIIVGFRDTITANHIPGLTLRMVDLPRIS